MTVAVIVMDDAFASGAIPSIREAQFEIYVRTLSGKSTPLDVKSSDSILNVKYVSRVSSTARHWQCL
jgi:hypothetical protein